MKRDQAAKNAHQQVGNAMDMSRLKLRLRAFLTNRV
jgi:hypothetical protein